MDGRKGEFRGVYSDAPVNATETRVRRDYAATGAIISLPRNVSFAKAKPAVPRGGYISVIRELE